MVKWLVSVIPFFVRTQVRIPPEAGSTNYYIDCCPYDKDSLNALKQVRRQGEIGAKIPFSTEKFLQFARFFDKKSQKSKRPLNQQASIP